MRSGGGGGGGDCDQRCRRRGKCVWAFVPCLTVRPASFCPGGGLHDDVCRNLVGALVRTLLDFWEKRQESRFTTQRERETEGSAGSGQEPPACFLGNKKIKILTRVLVALFSILNTNHLILFGFFRSLSATHKLCRSFLPPPPSRPRVCIFCPPLPPLLGSLWFTQVLACLPAQLRVATKALSFWTNCSHSKGSPMV